ncbi:MAG: Gfo/Idh/MocA family oxidoreductase [Deltaproteobacteria bacterium]|nr:Gfo/Idh/MocA family oxidoreductase [Deltaproteobacteria bacterium]
MYNVKIFGAGSIGNHLAHACRRRGWQVSICDLDPAALERTKSEIYPARYGAWDEEIRLASPAELAGDDFDLVIIGTPPDTHMSLACEVLRQRPPRVLLIEKPVCTPALEEAETVLRLQEETGTFVAVGYNHTLTRHSRRAAELLAGGLLGKTLTITAAFREYWGGIFSAHPWLAGPRDSYLGFASRGGGAGGEHSHAVNIWQFFAQLTGTGRITEVSAMLDLVADGQVDYDRLFLLNVKTETGLVGAVVQDVVTEPPQKTARLQGESGFLEWLVNYDAGHDALRYAGSDGEIIEELFAKTRPDDFAGEIDHLGEILRDGPPDFSPIALCHGLDTMLVVAAAHLSHRRQRTVRINYDAGYGLQALEPV